MPKVTFLPDNRDALVRPGTSVLAAARQAGVTIRTRCGGVAGCLMCKIKIAGETGVSSLTNQEIRKLGDTTTNGTRLACQTKVTGDVVVEVPEDPLKAAVRRQLERRKEEEELW